MSTKCATVSDSEKNLFPNASLYNVSLPAILLAPLTLTIEKPVLCDVTKDPDTHTGTVIFYLPKHKVK